MGRGQAAIEFVMNYGIAIMAVLIALGALAYFGVLNPNKILPSACLLEPGLGCVETKVNRDTVYLAIRNGRGENLNITSIRIANCNGSSSGFLENGKMGEFAIGGCSNTPNTKFKAEINITYAGEKSAVVHSKLGSIVDTVEDNCGNSTTCACDNTDTHCGTWPVCTSCNVLDSYSGNYCSGNSVYRNFSDYGCSSQSCVPTITPELVQNCAGNQACQSGACVNLTCAGGIPIYTCTATKPIYCNAAQNFVNNCTSCGCNSGQVCQGDGSCVNAVAQFSASYSNLCMNCGSAPPGFPGPPYNWWYFDTTLREIGGIIGITANSRQKCYNSQSSGYSCGSVQSDIATRFGTNYIPPSGQIVWNGNAVWIASGDVVTVNETYWGVDNNSNNVQASYSFTIP